MGHPHYAGALLDVDGWEGGVRGPDGEPVSGRISQHPNGDRRRSGYARCRRAPPRPHLGHGIGPQSDAFPAACSLVEFRVHEADVGCRVELRHSKLPSAEVAQANEGGWRFHLSRMALYANRTDLEAGLERTLEGWFSAWSEPDEATRLETLKSCCADEIEFRDDWTVAGGIEALNQHISMCFMFMPGWRLESTGDVRICRGQALVGWRSVGPDGTAIEGFNHVVAARDGTLRRVAGFQAA